MGSEMGPLSSPGTISYRLPIVTLGLSDRFRSAPDVPYRQTDGIGLAIGGSKVHRPPKNVKSQHF